MAGSGGRRGATKTGRQRHRGARKTEATASPDRRPLGAIAAALAGLVVIAVAAVVVLGGSPAAAPSATAADGTVVQGDGGHWTSVGPDTLAAMLDAKDFTLLNVKTPYIGEIEDTDLYIPYDQLAGRASELPADKSARIVVYCRSGNESAIAAQTLLDLGYTDIVDLDGGMSAWVASGRSIIQKART